MEILKQIKQSILFKEIEVGKTKQQLFHLGPFEDATNNIGEFLAIVHALGYLKKQKTQIQFHYVQLRKLQLGCRQVLIRFTFSSQKKKQKQLIVSNLRTQPMKLKRQFANLACMTVHLVCLIRYSQMLK